MPIAARSDARERRQGLSAKLDLLSNDRLFASRTDKAAFAAQYASRAVPYSREDTVLDALAELPAPAMIEKLVELLRPKELRVVAAGVLNDCTVAVRTLEPVNCATAINDWVATAEELVMFRGERRRILAAREKADAEAKKAK